MARTRESKLAAALSVFAQRNFDEAIEVEAKLERAYAVARPLAEDYYARIEEEEEALRVAKSDQKLVRLLGDPVRTAAYFKRDPLLGYLQFNLERAAERNPAVKEAISKASVHQPELARVIEAIEKRALKRVFE